MADSASGESSIESPGWNAVYTRHQHEKFVAETLRKNGFEVFYPTYPVIRRWTDRNKRLTLSQSPCYVFLRSCFDQRWKLFATPGIHSLVMFGNSPASISESEIEAIRRVVSSNFRVEPHPFLNCGDWVRIKSGPLIDLEGILVSKKSSYRLILSLDLLGKSVALEVDAFSVQPLSYRPARRLIPSTRVKLLGDHLAAGQAGEYLQQAFGPRLDYFSKLKIRICIVRFSNSNKRYTCSKRNRVLKLSKARFPLEEIAAAQAIRWFLSSAERVDVGGIWNGGAFDDSMRESGKEQLLSTTSLLDRERQLAYS